MEAIGGVPIIDILEIGDSLLLRSEITERKQNEKALPETAHHIFSVYELCNSIDQFIAKFFTFSFWWT
jgi:hypothetical protein